MTLIERYITAVTERLPAELREDVGRELRSNIEDMLPEDASEKEVREVLEKLGNPKKLSGEYNPVKRYLIGPALFENYISVLKLVVGICAVVFAALSLVANIVALSQSQTDFQSVAKIFGNLITATIEGGMQAAIWVTVVFAVLEKSGVNERELPFGNKTWSVDDLPEYPVYKGKKISRAESVVSIFFTILFTALLYFQPQLLALYFTDKGVTNHIPIFNLDRLEAYLPFILLVAALQLSLFVWKFMARHWTIPIAIGNTLVSVAACILTVTMVSDNTLFNSSIIEKIVNHAGTKITDNITIWWSGSIKIFIIVFVVICIADSAAGFFKCRKTNTR